MTFHLSSTGIDKENEKRERERLSRGKSAIYQQQRKQFAFSNQSTKYKFCCIVLACVVNFL